MTTALTKPLPGLTVADLLMLELPHIPEAAREDIAWGFTGWPYFFDPKEGEWWHDVFRRQLREFREGKPTPTESTDAE